MTEIVRAYGWCILQVTLLSVVAGTVYLVARRTRAAGNASLLAMSLAVVALLTLLSFSPWPRWNWRSLWPPRLSVDDSAALNSTVAADFLPAIDEFRADHPSEATAGDMPPAARAVQQGSRPVPGAVAAAARRPWEAIAVVMAWSVGVMGLVRLAVGLLHLRQCRRRSLPINDAALVGTIDELSARFSGMKHLDVRESPATGVPATIGWLRPTILLPRTWRNWSADERRAVLAHELAHVEDRHFRAWFVGQLALALHLYHPLVHWLARRLRLELELAADRLAASAFGDRQRYTVALAGLALGSRPSSAFAQVGLFMTRPLLMRRIAMLHQPDKWPPAQSRSLRGLALLMVLAATLAVVGLRGQPAATAADSESSSANDTTTNQTGELPETSALPPETTTAKPFVVTALFQVSRQPPSLLGTDSQPISDAAWSTFCNTQVALVKSEFVLRLALRDPKIASLPPVRSEPDPVSWLQSHLQVGFRPHSEILAVQMRGNQDEVDQLKQLVGAVVDAYLRDIVFGQRQRMLNERDALAKSLVRLNGELARRMEEAHDIAIELGSAEHGGTGQIEQQLALKRLDRIEAELMRLENEQLAAKLQAEQTGEPTPDLKARMQFYEQRIAQLRERQDELEKKIRASSEESIDLQTRMHDVERLQHIVDEMTRKLEVVDVETSSAPDRIRLIQPAMVSRAAETDSPTAPPQAR